MSVRKSARRLALRPALAYILSAGLYIVVSGRLASALSTSQEQLAMIEAAKGIAFVVVTSLLLWFLLAGTLERVLSSEAEADETRRAYVEGERRAAGDVLAASIAHDINNVLTAIDHLGLLLRTESPTDLIEIADDLAAVNRRLHQLVERMAAYGGIDDATVEACDLVVLVTETMRIARTHGSVRTCLVELDLPARFPFHGRPLLIHQALLNMVLNAAAANRGTGRLLVRLGGPGGKAADLAELEVHDQGPGIPVADRKRILDPFVTSKAGGTGLGMVSMTACALAHGGQVRIGESAHGGAMVALELRSLRPD